jgi:hypothetical protein
LRQKTHASSGRGMNGALEALIEFPDFDFQKR